MRGVPGGRCSKGAVSNWLRWRGSLCKQNRCSTGGGKRNCVAFHTGTLVLVSSYMHADSHVAVETALSYAELSGECCLFT